MISDHKPNQSFQVATLLEQMLSTDEYESDPDPRQFHNWEGTGAAQILLPDVTEKKFSAKKRSRKCVLL